MNKLVLLNTRPQLENAQLELKENIQVIHCPVFKITPLCFEYPHALFKKIHKIIFVSPNAVDCFFLNNKPFINTWPTHAAVFVIGHGTAKSLDKYRIQYSLPTTTFNSEGLLALPCFQSVAEEHIALIKGEDGLTTLEDELNKRQAIIHQVLTYKRQPCTDLTEKLWSLYHHQSIDLILITSETTLTTLFDKLPGPLYPWLLAKTYIVFSERLAKKARSLGLKHIITTSSDQYLTRINQFACSL